MSKRRAAEPPRAGSSTTDRASEGRTTLDERSRALMGRVAKDPAAREELVRTWLPLAESLARRFVGRKEPLEDLVQVASIGLIKAIDRFDAERGVAFSTFATPTILGELKRYFRDRSWDLHVPRRLQETGLLLRSAIPALSQELGRSPTVEEIAAKTELTEEEILEGVDVMHAHTIDSLDAGLAGEPNTHALDAIGRADERLEVVEEWTAIAVPIKKLPARERVVLYLRFVRGMTQDQIAERLGISQMHVSRILSRTLAQLRKAAAGRR